MAMNEHETIRKALELGHMLAGLNRLPVFEAGKAALATLEARAREPFAWIVACPIYGSIFCAPYEQAAHEHINDAISEHGIHEARSWVVRKAYATPPIQAQREPSVTINSGAIRALRELTDCDDPQNDADITIAWLDNAPIDDDGNVGSGYFCWFTELPEEGHIPIDLGPNIRLPWSAQEGK